MYQPAFVPQDNGPEFPAQNPACTQHDIHALIKDIIHRTESIFTQPTIYDVLRIPGYKSWEDHVANMEALWSWFFGETGCLCSDRMIAIVESESLTLNHLMVIQILISQSSQRSVSEDLG